MSSDFRRCKSPDGEPHPSTPLPSTQVVHNPAPSDDAGVYIGIDSEWVTQIDPVTSKPYNQVLSYQAVLEHRGRSVELIHYPLGKSRRHRLSFGRFIELVLKKALREKVISDFPDHLVIFCHFLRADLPTFLDFWSLKKKFEGFGRTFTANSIAFDLEWDDPPDQLPPSRARTVCVFTRGKKRDLKRVLVRFADTTLLTPNRAGLATVAELLGTSKVSLPPGHTIDRMDKLLAADKPAFEAYALQDARIALDYGLRMVRLAREIGLTRLPTSLAGFAIATLRREVKRQATDLNSVLGLEVRRWTEFNEATGRYRTQTETVSTFSRQIFDEFAALAYHGGRGESYWFGPTPIGVFHDYDLPGAYTTAMCLLRPLDYDRAHLTRDLEDFTSDSMGAARVEFEFPAGTRFPCLPVRDRDSLFFPLRGVSVCTAPEIVLARRLGAKIKILNGLVIPWASDLPIFESFTELVQSRRLKALKNTLEGRVWKEIGNSLYGKLGQGVRQKRVFNPKRGRSEQMPPSAITTPWFAAYVTGLVRTVLGEILAGVPRHRIVVSATTDGFLTDAPRSELTLDGTFCRMFSDVRQRMFDEGTVLEEKHRVAQIIAMKTRGQITSEILPGYDEPVLAKAGVKPNAPQSEHNDYMLRLFLDRTPGQFHKQTSLISLQEMWHTESDLVSIERNLRLNLEFDFKRKPVCAVENEVRGRKHLAFSTEPWTEVYQAGEAVERFREWTRSHGRILKTLSDYYAWDAHRSMVGPVRSAGVGIRSGGPVGHLFRQFLRALVRGEWGVSLEGGGPQEHYTYRDIVYWLNDKGYDATIDDLKNAKRQSSKLAPRSLYVDDEALELLRVIAQEFPKFDFEALILPEQADEVRTKLGF
jgi:hypothetical protein